jgi:hypothetical protein
VNDDVFDLDQPIRITSPGFVELAIFTNRSIHDIWTSINERFDPAFVPTARVRVSMEKDAPPAAPGPPPLAK